MRIRLLLGIALLCLCSCSSKFGYNNLDWLVHWYLDDYVELNAQQLKDFDQRFVALHKWHRQSELRQYRAQLVSLSAKLEQGPLSEQQWLDEFSQTELHWLRFRDKIVPELMTMAPELTDKQIESLFTKLAENEAERLEEREENPQKRLKKATEGTIDDIEEWTGHLNTVQKSLIRDAIPEFKGAFEAGLTYRRNLQQAAKGLLEQRQDPAAMNQLQTLLLAPEAQFGQDVMSIRQYNRQQYAALYARLNRSLSDKQKRHVQKELQQLIEDLTDLLEQ